jgi:nicotinamide phosphoribosyltransferase
VSSYVESRGGEYEKTLFFGVQSFIREYLLKPITQEEIDFAEKFWTAHGEDFNRAGWEYILQAHDGRLPISLKSIDEGRVVSNKNVLAIIQNTDAKCWWLTTWIETALLRSIWYGTTVATQSWYIKQDIKKYLEKSGDITGLPYKCHDFGSRGVSSLESSILGGMAHLVNFSGTDNAVSILGAAEYYDADPFATAFSINAAEHSTITSWTRPNEVLAYENMIKQFSKPGSVYAVVSDSYDIYRAIDIWGTLKDKIVSTGGTLVIRPDSGDPCEVLPKIIKKLDTYFGTVTNDKGYKVLNNVRLIWGDGINRQTINAILRLVVDVMGYSADNIAFGMGGQLLQIVNRDTLEFALKCSAAKINDRWVDVYKDPVTDSGKKSKKGRLEVVNTEDGDIRTIEDTGMVVDSALSLRFVNGFSSMETTFSEVRARSES